MFPRNDKPGEIPVTLIFSGINLKANTISPLTLLQGSKGIKVPEGFVFHPICLSGNSNPDILDGNMTFEITDNGHSLFSGPRPILSDGELQKTSLESADEAIRAGHVIGVSVTPRVDSDINMPNVDAVLIGVFVPIA